ncbi:MAG: ABC transporter transmembrane domain-containing protein, partial [Smithellaceae bacterium]
METFKRLLKMAKKYYILLSLAMLCMLVAGALQSAQALLVKPILDDIFLGKNPNALKWIPLAVIGIFLVKGASNYGQTIMMNYIGLRIVTNLRNKLYEQIQRQSLAFFTQHPTGILMSRITNDVSSIQAASSEAVTSLIKDTVTLISLIGVVFYTDWKLAIVATIVFPLAIYPISTLG